MSASEQIAQNADQELGNALIQILPEILTPDSKTIEKATERFRGLSQKEAFLPTLTQIMVSEQTEPSSRQLAAVLFRRRILKGWKNYKPDMQMLVRQASLEYLSQADKSIYKHLAEIVAGIAEYEIPRDGWPNLTEVLNQTTTSNNYQIRLRGTELLKYVCQSSTDPLIQRMPVMMQMFGNLLNAPDVTCGDRDSGQNVHKNVIEAFEALAPFMEPSHVQSAQQVLPRLIVVCEELVAWDEHVGTEALSVFSDLCDLESVNLVTTAHTKSMAEVSLKIATNTELEEETRAVALAQIQMLVKFKKKAFTKFGLVKPLIEHMQKCIMDEDDPDDGIMAGTDGDRTVYTGALQVLDQLASDGMSGDSD